jgi:hypothetical protein
MVQALGFFWPVAREGAELLYQFEAPYIVDGGKFQRAFASWTSTPHREGIRHTLDWYRDIVHTEQAGKIYAWWQEVLRYGETPRISR